MIANFFKRILTFFLDFIIKKRVESRKTELDKKRSDYVKEIESSTDNFLNDYERYKSSKDKDV